MTSHGLSKETVGKICAVLARHPAVERVVLYGSRAKGNCKPGSDIDLSLHGAGLSLPELWTINDELDELLLPYSIDVLIFEQLAHEKLKEHIERVGVVFYQRKYMPASSSMGGEGCPSARTDLAAGQSKKSDD